MKKSLSLAVILGLALALGSTAANAAVNLQTGQTAAGSPQWSVNYYGFLNYANEDGSPVSFYDPSKNEDTKALLNSSNIIESYTNANGGIRVYDDMSNTLFTNPSWSKPGANEANWIGVWNGQSVNPDGSPNPGYTDTVHEWNLGGFYGYTTSFELGANTLSGGLQGQFWKDNDIVGIQITKDGVSHWLNLPAGTENGTAEGEYINGFDLGGVDLKDLFGSYAGNYDLTFFVTNGWTFDRSTSNTYCNDEITPWHVLGPTGFRSELFVESTEIKENPTPEPATMAIIGLGMLGAGTFARRRMSK